MHASRHSQQPPDQTRVVTRFRQSVSGRLNPAIASRSCRGSSNQLVPQGLSAQPVRRQGGCRSHEAQQFRCRRRPTAARSAPTAAAEVAVRDEQDVPGMGAFLDRLKWDAAGLAAVVVQVAAV